MNTKTALSHLRRPADLTPDAWQRQLRRQFGREQRFKVENLGDEPVFSEYRVTNPKSGGAYRVALRGAQPGDNFCACPDFATNDLGTCKHIEFVLARLERRPGGVEGMLSILAFKKSLFAGVLDGGPSEVLLGGSRLKRFMDSVEAVTAAAATPAPDAPSAAARPPVAAREVTPFNAARDVTVQASASSSGQKGDLSQQRASSGAAAATLEYRQPADSWASLLSAGLKLVESLTAASSGNGDGAAGASSRWIETDAETGRPYVKLPVPDAQVLQTLGDALSRLVSSLGK
jgi:hypothetical protein